MIKPKTKQTARKTSSNRPMIAKIKAVAVADQAKAKAKVVKAKPADKVPSTAKSPKPVNPEKGPKPKPVPRATSTESAGIGKQAKVTKAPAADAGAHQMPKVASKAKGERVKLAARPLSTVTETREREKNSGRVSALARRQIAEEIIMVGAGSLNVERLAMVTGLAVQQVRSQVVVNRNNLRRELMDYAKSL